MQKENLTREQALEASISHWEENVKLAEERGLSFHHISGGACALCYKYHKGFSCGECPLSEAGMECDDDNSPWKKVGTAMKAGDKEKIVAAARAMLTVLKNLRKD